MATIVNTTTSSFCDIVGICDQGPLVDDVSKSYPQITEVAVKHVWKVGALLNWFEVANYIDKEQTLLFH